MLDNLIKDMHDVITGVKAPATDKAQHNVNVSYAKWYKEREHTRDKNKLHFSEIGSVCKRQLWYKYHSAVGNIKANVEPLDATALLKFFYGDILEELVLNVAEDAGYSVTNKQDRVEYVHGDWKVTGRIDAVINDVLIDVKSTTKYGAIKFENGLKDDPFGYKAQLGGYAYALGYKQAAFLTVQKELGHIGLHPISTKDIENFESELEKSITAVSLSSPDNLEQIDPVPQSATSPNLKLDVTCSYCSFKQECWKQANNGEGIKTFLYSGKPEFIVKVVRQPKVKELIL